MKDIHLLEALLKCGSQDTLLEVIDEFLVSHYDSKNIAVTKDYVFARGTIPIMLVAHLDTVLTEPPKKLFKIQGKNVICGSNGLGADDRVGVFMILEILKAGLRPSVLFTTDEECGGLGADAFIAYFKRPTDDYKYIIQLDRRGENDCVFYDCQNKKFVNYIKKFGWEPAKGIFSDISIICPVWGVAGVNLSVGYINEHTPYEMLDLDIMMRNLDRVIEMLKADLTNVPEFKYQGKRYCDFHECVICGTTHSTVNLLPLSNGKWCCIDCIDWCVHCGQPFLGEGELCPTCRERVNVVKLNEEPIRVGG